MSEPVPELTGHGNFCGAAESVISRDLSVHDVNNGQVRSSSRIQLISAEPDPEALVTPKRWGSTDPFIFPSLLGCWILRPMLLSFFCLSLLLLGCWADDVHFNFPVQSTLSFPMVMREHMDREDL